MSKPGESFLLRALFKVFLPINASAGLHKNLLKREEGPAWDLGLLTKRTQLSCPDHARFFTYFNNFGYLTSAQPLQFKQQEASARPKKARTIMKIWPLILTLSAASPSAWAHNSPYRPDLEDRIRNLEVAVRELQSELDRLRSLRPTFSCLLNTAFYKMLKSIQE